MPGWIKLPEKLLVLGYTNKTNDFAPIILHDSDDEEFVAVFTSTQACADYLNGGMFPADEVEADMNEGESMAAIWMESVKVMTHADMDSLDYLALDPKQGEDRNCVRIPKPSLN